MPFGDHPYRVVQQRFGNLRADPTRRLPEVSKMLHDLTELGFRVEGTRCLEVGTGHVPVAPIGLFLAGAREVVTVDLNRRISWAATRRMLTMLSAAQFQVIKAFAGLAEPDELRGRLALVRELAEHPRQLFAQARIRYLAPGDAARLSDRDSSFDLQFSITVLEHVQPRALAGILAEGRRILRPNGYSAHRIDLSDHFAHGDRSISNINFLRFGADEWRVIAGNQYSYTNRLRASQYRDLFDAAGLLVDAWHGQVDEEALLLLKDGFPLHSDFAGADPTDLCTTSVSAYARPGLD